MAAVVVFGHLQDIGEVVAASANAAIGSAPEAESFNCLALTIAVKTGFANDLSLFDFDRFVLSLEMSYVSILESFA